MSLQSAWETSHTASHYVPDWGQKYQMCAGTWAAEKYTQLQAPALLSCGRIELQAALQEIVRGEVFAVSMSQVMQHQQCASLKAATSDTC